MLPVPLERALQAVAELDLGLPAGQVAELGGVDELAVDLAGGVAGSVFGVEAAAGQLGDRLDNLGDRVGLLAAGVEGLASGRTAGANRVLDRVIGPDETSQRAAREGTEVKETA